jgi:ribosomal protein S1
VIVEGVRGTVPLSQIADLGSTTPAESLESRLEATSDRRLLPVVEERLNALIGSRLHLRVLEMNRRRNRVVLSEVAAPQS